jgi:hypothetical protein
MVRYPQEVSATTPKPAGRASAIARRTGGASASLASMCRWMPQRSRRFGSAGRPATEMSVRSRADGAGADRGGEQATAYHQSISISGVAFVAVFSLRLPQSFTSRTLD